MEFEEWPLKKWQIEREQQWFRAIRNSGWGNGFGALVTCDLENYRQFCDELVSSRRRPLSLYAYLARNVGLVLQNQTELVAARWGPKLLILSQINVVALLETQTQKGAFAPTTIVIENVGERTLATIAEQLQTESPALKRATPQLEKRSRFSPAFAPDWWNESVQRARQKTSQARRYNAQRCAHVQISSTTQ